MRASLAAAFLCLRMLKGEYLLLAQPITGTPLCTNDTGACRGCQGVLTDAGRAALAPPPRMPRKKHR